MAIDAHSLTRWDLKLKLAARELNLKFPTCSWGTYPGHDPREGLAMDGMIPGGATSSRPMTAAAKRLGDQVAKFLWDNRVRLKLWYVIWDRRIISRTYETKGWRPYLNPVRKRRGTPSGDHTNHVHWSAYEGGSYTPPADVVIPYGDGYLPAEPWIVYLDKLRPGVKNSDSVWLLQRALGIKPRTGAFGDVELQEVKDFQAELGDAPEFRDGLLGPLQAAKLFAGSLVKIEAKS